MPSPRADYRCDVCDERWELPVGYDSKGCPDEECAGLLHRVWDAAGSPRIGAQTFRQATRLLDHGTHARKPDISPELRRAMAETGHPGFMPQGPTPGQMLAPHFASISKTSIGEIANATARPVSMVGGKPRDVDMSGGGQGFAEPILAAAKARGRIVPNGGMVDRTSEARGQAMRAAFQRRVEGK